MSGASAASGLLAGPGCLIIVLTVLHWAQTRWYSFHFLVQQLVGALVRLRISLNLALPLLPGAEIPELPCSWDGTCTKISGDGAQNDMDQHGTAAHATGEKRRPTAVQIAVE